LKAYAGVTRIVCVHKYT